MPNGTHGRRLAVAMIARDAQDTIGGSLESVRAIADEIVVVDTGSNDDTGGVAASTGARLFHHAWADNFSAARNLAWSKVTSDWVLWLDANESISAAAARELRHFVDQAAESSAAYSLMVAVPPADAQISGEQVARVRLVPNRADIRFAGRVREHLHASLTRSGLSVEHLPWVIHRAGRDNDPTIKAEKARRNLRLVDLEIKSRGQEPELLIVLGEALAHLGDTAGATASFRMALRECQPGSAGMREAYYGLVAASSGSESSSGQLIGICVEALTQFPLDAQLLCALGGHLQAEDRLDQAARAYRTVFDHGEIDRELWHVPDIREIAGVCLAMVCQLRDDDDEAERILRDTITRMGDSVRARRHLIDLYIKHDRRKDALDEFDRLPPGMPQREATRSAIRGACLAARKNWVPAFAYLQTAYKAGCRDPLCLRWLTVSLIANDEIDAAAPILHEWHALEPRNIEARKYLDALAAGTLGTSGTNVSTSRFDGQVFRVDPPQSGDPTARNERAPHSPAATDRQRETTNRTRP